MADIDQLRALHTQSLGWVQEEIDLIDEQVDLLDKGFLAHYEISPVDQLDITERVIYRLRLRKTKLEHRMGQLRQLIHDLG